MRECSIFGLCFGGSNVNKISFNCKTKIDVAVRFEPQT